MLIKCRQRVMLYYYYYYYYYYMLLNKLSSFEFSYAYVSWFLSYLTKRQSRLRKYGNDNRLHLS
jgi:hypothetical protein